MGKDEGDKKWVHSTVGSVRGASNRTTSYHFGKAKNVTYLAEDRM